MQGRAGQTKLMDVIGRAFLWSNSTIAVNRHWLPCLVVINCDHHVCSFFIKAASPICWLQRIDLTSPHQVHAQYPAFSLSYLPT